MSIQAGLRLALGLSLLLNFSLETQALVLQALESPTQKGIAGQKMQWVSEGVVVGGRAGKPARLSELKWSLSDDNSEVLNLVLHELGRAPGFTLPPFFQVQLRPKKSQLVIDLDQVASVGVNPSTLAKNLRKSKCLKDVDFGLDPLDPSTHLVFALKKSCKIKVVQLSTGFQIFLR